MHLTHCPLARFRQANMAFWLFSDAFGAELVAKFIPIPINKNDA